MTELQDFIDKFLSDAPNSRTRLDMLNLDHFGVDLHMIGEDCAPPVWTTTKERTRFCWDGADHIQRKRDKPLSYYADAFLPNEKFETNFYSELDRLIKRASPAETLTSQYKYVRDVAEWFHKRRKGRK